MALGKCFDYDAESDEIIVTAGVEGLDVTWIGFDVDRKVLHIVYKEGNLNGTGDGIETITKKGQITLENSDMIDFYSANAAAFNAIINSCLGKAANDLGKTGEIIY